MRSYLVLGCALVLWTGFSVPRVTQPFKVGHDAYISSQIGGYANNHVKLGLGVTRGANLTAIDYSGAPRFYFSYTPLASWLLALLMQAGLPLYVAVRVFMLVLSVVFFSSLWFFARNLWGRRVADLAVLAAMLMPVSLRYGLACIWEVMALSPLLAALALFSSPRPRDGRWLACTSLAGIAAVMFSWIAWLVVVPCAIREMRMGRIRAGALTGAGALVAPVAVQFGALSVTGVSFADFLARCAYRLGPPQVAEAVPGLSYGQLVGKIFERFIPMGFGPIPVILMAVVVLAVIVSEIQGKRGRVPRGRWLLLLLAYAIPLNVLDVAKYHDFFIILLVPLAAISTGIACNRAFERMPRWREADRAFLSVPLLVVFVLLITGTWPARALFVPAQQDYAVREIARELGARAEGDSVIVMSPSLAALVPNVRPPANVESRDVPMQHTFACFTEKSGILSYDHEDLTVILAELADWHRPVVIFAKGRELGPLPPMKRVRKIRDYTIGEYRP